MCPFMWQVKQVLVNYVSYYTHLLLHIVFMYLSRNKNFDYKLKTAYFGDFLLCRDDKATVLRSFHETPCVWFNSLLKNVNLIMTYKPVIVQ